MQLIINGTSPASATVTCSNDEAALEAVIGTTSTEVWQNDRADMSITQNGTVWVATRTYVPEWEPETMGRNWSTWLFGTGDDLEFTGLLTVTTNTTPLTVTAAMLNVNVALL